jgi:hypothetical protein
MITELLISIISHFSVCITQCHINIGTVFVKRNMKISVEKAVVSDNITNKHPIPTISTPYTLNNINNLRRKLQ